MPRSQAIVCVDDERMVLQSLRDQLIRHFGHQYRYELAESAEEAFEVIEELIIEDVEVLTIVSDWLMPNVKGDEFLIHVHQRFPHIVTIMLTGQASEAAVERARQQANLHCFVSKPWDEFTLVEAITSGLEKTDG
jgi:CheY-like chemotaxis protein